VYCLRFLRSRGASRISRRRRNRLLGVRLLEFSKGERRIITHCSWEAFGDFAAMCADEKCKTYVFISE
jgi:hypothetical protein